MNQKTFNTCKSNFELTDVYALASIIGHGCRQKTKDKLISTLIYETARIPNYGILERLMFENYAWSYCAGQDHRSEIKTIRNIILRGK
jgi:hypothetical protein